MRSPFLHLATLEMSENDDDRAPGAAITLALCGSWEHSPPCPLAAHHTQPVRDGRPWTCVWFLRPSLNMRTRCAAALTEPSAPEQPPTRTA